MSFAQDLGAFAKKTDRRTDAVVRKIVLDVGVSLVLKSPVGDASYWLYPAPPGYVGGRFRGNWQYGFEAINPATNEDVDPTGASSIGRVEAGCPIGAAGFRHFITNSLAYGPRLEEGWSRQAPQGMVKLTVKEFKSTVAAAAGALT